MPQSAVSSAEPIQDTGIGVRKRVIKLLKNFSSVSEDPKHRIDVGTRLVLRILDDDETVRDLAVKTVEELWFQSSSLPTSSQKSASTTLGGADGKGSLLAKVSVIMGVAANFKDRQSPLEDVLRKIISSKDDKDAPTLHARYAEICETLIDGLVDASDLPGFVCLPVTWMFHC
jgi:cohesin loading factor subunit SCC2